MKLPLQLNRRTLLLASGGGVMAATGIGATCSSQSKTFPDEGPGLASLGQRTGLPIGSFMSDSSFADPQFMRSLVNNYNLLAPMNELKRRTIEPVQGKLNFRRADHMVAWAQSKNMRIHGHTLVWYKADPPWLAPVLEKSRDEHLLAGYVSQMVSRYRGRIQSWDVVNEAIRPEDGRPDGLRDTIWSRAFGEKYIDIAFHAARKADPNALLLFSDYGLETDHPVAEARRKATLGLLERALKRGVPIGGVGLHAHFRRYGFQFDGKVLKPFLDRLKELGLKIMVTEFDIADWKGPLSAEQRDQDVADLTKSFASLVFSYDNLRGFISFGVSDRYTWLNKERPLGWLAKVRGLPLDEDFGRKPMWYALADALKSRPASK